VPHAEVTVYCDDVQEAKLENHAFGLNEKWTYLGLLIVPNHCKDNLSQKLCELRGGEDTEVHYVEAGSGPKFRVAKTWLNFLIEHNKKDMGWIYFYILGINLMNLDLSRFGPRNQQDRHMTIYNRFFRTALLKSLKTYFSASERIIVRQIFHDNSPGRHHRYFPWHAIHRINTNDPRITIEEPEIRFINSDHRERNGDPVESHFIQFIDVILGSTVNCLHYSSQNENKVALAEIMLPLVDRLLNRPRNVNSRYHYVGRQRIEFFPSVDFNNKSEDEILAEFQRHGGTYFYTGRELPIKRRKQPTLWDQRSAHN